MSTRISRQLALSALCSLTLSACDQTETAPRGDVSVIARPTSADELKAPALNFTKTDRTGDAELRSELSFGQVSQLESPLAQVIPIPLSEGDRASVSVWSDQPSALMVYSPSDVDGLWQVEERRLLTEARKEGLEALTLSWSAAQAGRYALVVVPVEGSARHLITAQCEGGPCLTQLADQAQESVTEEREATERPASLP